MKRYLPSSRVFYVIALILISCDDEHLLSREQSLHSANANQPKAEVIDLTLAPELHNDFCLWYYTVPNLPDLSDTEYCPSHLRPSLSERSARIAAYCQFYLKEVRGLNYGELFDSNDLSSYTELFSILDRKENQDFPTPEDLDLVFRQSTSQFQFGEGYYRFINDVYQRAYDGASVEQLMDYINRYDQSSLEEEDVVHFDVFRQQANASYFLWTDNNSPLATPSAIYNCPPGGLKCGTWVIIVDGLGCAVGTIFGGAGCAVTGPILSIGASEDCDCDICPY